MYNVDQTRCDFFNQLGQGIFTPQTEAARNYFPSAVILISGTMVWQEKGLKPSLACFTTLPQGEVLVQLGGGAPHALWGTLT